MSYTMGGYASGRHGVAPLPQGKVQEGLDFPGCTTSYRQSQIPDSIGLLISPISRPCCLFVSQA